MIRDLRYRFWYHLLLTGIALVLSGAGAQAQELQTLSGQTTTLEVLAEQKPVVVHLWASWCAPCRRELPDLADFINDTKALFEKNQIIIISADTRPSGQIADFLMDTLKDTEFKTYRASPDVLGQRFQSTTYPSTLFLSAEGHIERKINGPADWNSATFRQAVLSHFQTK